MDLLNWDRAQEFGVELPLLSFGHAPMHVGRVAKGEEAIEWCFSRIPDILFAVFDGNCLVMLKSFDVSFAFAAA